MRLTPAHLFAVAALLASSGCYASHELEVLRPPVRPDAGPSADGGVRPLPDGGFPLDAPFATDLGPAVDGGSCAHSELHVDVRVEPVGGPEADCMRTSIGDLEILGVDPEASVNGIRIHGSYRGPDPVVVHCDVIVSNVGVDLAPVLPRGAGFTMDVRTGYLSYVSIRRAVTCACDGCPCSLSLVFYAADAQPDIAEHTPSDIVFSQLRVVCGDPTSCAGGNWYVHARTAFDEGDVPEGTTSHFGPIWVRSVRDVDVFGPCAACATCGTVSGSFAAWVATFEG